MYPRPSWSEISDLDLHGRPEQTLCRPASQVVFYILLLRPEWWLLSLGLGAALLSPAAFRPISAQKEKAIQEKNLLVMVLQVF